MAGLAVLSAVPGAAVARAADASTCSDGGPCIVVTIENGRSEPVHHEVGTAELASLPTQPGGQFSQGGGRTTDEIPDYVALSDVLTSDAVGISIPNVTFVDITAGGAPPDHLRSAAELAAATDPTYAFADSPHVPGVYTTGTRADEIAYIRPIRNAQDTVDMLSTSSGGVLNVTVHESGSLLYPHITASPTASHTSPRVVTLAASVDGDPTGLTYTWDFGDGSPQPASRQDVRHRYSAGTWSPTLRVSRASDGSESDLVNVRLSIDSSRNATGKPRGGGGTGDKTEPSNGPVTGTGTRAGGRTLPGGDGSGTPAGSTSAHGAGGPAGSSSAATGTSGAATAGAGRPSARPSAGTTVHGSAAVAGFLLTPPTVAARPVRTQSPADRLAQAAPARREVTAAKRLSPVVFGVLGVLLLLGVGAFAEVRPLRQERRGRRT